MGKSGKRLFAGAGAVLGIAQTQQQAAALRVGRGTGRQQITGLQVMTRRLFVRLRRCRTLGGPGGVFNGLADINRVAFDGADRRRCQGVLFEGGGYAFQAGFAEAIVLVENSNVFQAE